MNKSNFLIDRIKIGLGITLLGALTGCGGHMDDGYNGYDRYDGYNGYGYFGSYDDEGPNPDLYLFGGGYERGRDVHNYSRRGFGSRGSGHFGGGMHGGGGNMHGGGGHGSGR